MRLHMGSGTVYLHGWINLDVPGPRTQFASDRPDLVARYGTTDEAYYARHADKTLAVMRGGPLDQEYVCDQYGDFANLPSGEITEVLARHCWEHLSITEARRALRRLRERMPKGALLRLDVPDHDATLKLFRQTGDEFYIRHLLGPRRNDYGFHLMSYTKDRLQALVEEYGFKLVAEEPNIHVYPAFCLRFEKQTDDAVTLPAPRDYVPLPFEIPSRWNVVDVGPGNYPLQRANAYVDHCAGMLEKLPASPAAHILSDLNRGLPEIPDKAFDYAWCSHVLEHVDDVAAAARTLSRIAHRGTIVMPSAYKEALFNFEEAEHKWSVLPDPNNGPPVFVRNHLGIVTQLKDELVQQAACQLFRTGMNHDCTSEEHTRDWFVKNECWLDVVYHWNDALQLQVIQ